MRERDGESNRKMDERQREQDEKEAEKKRDSHIAGDRELNCNLWPD